MMRPRIPLLDRRRLRLWDLDLEALVAGYMGLGQWGIGRRQAERGLGGKWEWEWEGRLRVLAGACIEFSREMHLGWAVQMARA